MISCTFHFSGAFNVLFMSFLIWYMFGSYLWYLVAVMMVDSPRKKKDQSCIIPSYLFNPIENTFH